MEITRVINECGCKLAFPTTHLDLVPRDFGEAIVNGVVDYQNDLEREMVSRPVTPPEDQEEPVSSRSGSGYPKIRIVPNQGPAPPPNPDFDQPMTSVGPFPRPPPPPSQPAAAMA
jgi:hypothetical protein